MTTETTGKPLSTRQWFALEYLALLNEEFETRDYSVYADDAELVRSADIAFMDKVGHAFRTDSEIWS